MMGRNKKYIIRTNAAKTKDVECFKCRSKLLANRAFFLAIAIFFSMTLIPLASIMGYRLARTIIFSYVDRSLPLATAEYYKSKHPDSNIAITPAGVDKTASDVYLNGVQINRKVRAEVK
jgi:hypothetical protein